MTDNTNYSLNKKYLGALFFHIIFLSIIPFAIFFIALIQFTSISITRLDEVLELIIMILLFMLSIALPFIFNKKKSKFLENKKSPLSFFITRTFIVFFIFCFGYLMFNLTGNYPLLGYFYIIGFIWTLLTIPRKSEFTISNIVKVKQ